MFKIILQVFCIEVFYEFNLQFILQISISVEQGQNKGKKE